VTGLGTCTHCAKTKRLNTAGLVVRHLLTIDVSRRAISVVGAGRVRRVCGGSGRLPREAPR
jgi:hypothetical protein